MIVVIVVVIVVIVVAIVMMVAVRAEVQPPVQFDRRLADVGTDRQ
jgi:hypothetical protein